MPIDVVCPGCHKRFQVSDKFAGKEGPCPSCKAKIRVPDKSEEVVIHAPEPSGPVDSKGKSILKPIKRREQRLSTVAIVGLAGLSVAVLAVALYLRGYGGEVSTWILGLGAVVLGPPLAWGGYLFLRNQELEPFEGNALWGRIAICGLIYAVLWGMFAGGHQYIFEGDVLEIYELIILVVPVIFLGVLVAHGVLELEIPNSIAHYGFYLSVTVALRLLMNLPAY